MTLGRLATLAVTAIIWHSVAPSAAAQDASYEFYKTKVQPIFLKHREGRARCVTCHAGAGLGFVLAPLTPGSKDWNEEQTKWNFDAVSKLVSPGKPLSSQLLMHPLDPDSGGDVFHSGGRQFSSQNDPDWQTIAAWVNQMPKAEYTNLKLLQGSEDHLMDIMRSYNLALRAECVFCHAAPDFASDKRPTKVMARKMITMTEDLNKTLGKGRVTCYTCHEGFKNPPTTHPRFPQLNQSY